MGLVAPTVCREIRLDDQMGIGLDQDRSSGARLASDALQRRT
jgi:hypothetical protein